jgi:hypothetical protein
MNLTDAMTYAGRVLFAFGLMLFLAVYGNAIGKTAAMVIYEHNSAHPSHLASADASGAGPSHPHAPLATYSGEE